MQNEAVFTEKDLEAVIGWTVIRAARQSTRLLAATLKVHDLSPVEFGVLAQVAVARTGLTQAEVARAAEIRPQSAAPVIASLEERALLRREGVRGRGRAGRLLLTENGSKLLSAAFPDVLTTNVTIAGEPASATTVNGALLQFLETTRDTQVGSVSPGPLAST
jgi:DNA-binding MarR family transcriptional regulator